MMPGKLSTALHVVTPYGASTSGMLNAEDTAALIRKGKEGHKTMQDILGSLTGSKKKSHGQVRARRPPGKELQMDESIRNLCLNLSRGLHLKPALVRRYIVKPLATKGSVIHPPQNSYVDDPMYKSEIPITRNLKPKPEFGTHNGKCLAASLLPEPKRFSCVTYEFNKVCKMIPHMPNPVSRQLYEEMKSRRIKSAEMVQLKKMPCYHDHVEHHEPPCVSYFSPKPSQLNLHKQKDRLEKDVKASMTSNSTIQAPLSTVEVFLNIASKYTLEDFLTELVKYGSIESIVRQSERSYRVVYSDLVGACKAVTGLKTNKDLYCNWHHRYLDRRKFVKRRKGPLKVVISQFGL